MSQLIRVIKFKSNFPLYSQFLLNYASHSSFPSKPDDGHGHSHANKNQPTERDIEIKNDVPSQNDDGKTKYSPRLAEFRKKLREKSPITELAEQSGRHPFQEQTPLEPWPEGVNPHTGERNGPAGPEPTRYGDWERKGRVSDF